ncbi:MAG: glycosyltransferase family 4 protein [Acidobacteriota bacterium]|nr:glycosyltransferase family 4 protein [Acidobacteriota bacterium]
MKPRILFLVPASFDALRKKGVERMILERDEDGFFARVVTVHPLAAERRVIDLNPVHRIYELGIGQGLGAPLRALAAFAAVVRIARDERVDIIRATDAYLMGLMAWWVSRLLHLPFCVSIHADYRKRFELSPRGWLRHALRRAAGVLPLFVLPRADLVLPIRDHLVPSLVAAGADPLRIKVIPHGVDLTPFRRPLADGAREMFELPPHAKVVSFAGRLTADNYVADMLQAIACVATRRHDAMFVIAGEGPEAPAVRQMIASLPNPAMVRLLPFQPYDRIVALRRISSASLCLMAGFSLIEACAAGSPPIAYDVEWHRELVDDAVSGYLVAEGDIASVVAAIDRLLDDGPTAALMGARAQAAVFARHDLVHTSQIKRACYAFLLDRSRLATAS